MAAASVGSSAFAEEEKVQIPAIAITRRVLQRGKSRVSGDRMFKSVTSRLQFAANRKGPELCCSGPNFCRNRNFGKRKSGPNYCLLLFKLFIVFFCNRLYRCDDAARKFKSEMASHFADFNKIRKQHHNFLRQ